jgi:spore coat polysaccharide biosynthesis predicted glycosyltransferase SpsG
MSALPEIRVLFRAAAGTRRGFGHLVRCRSLARALGVRPLVCVRGTGAARDVALRIGCDVVNGSAKRLLAALKPDVLVIDDPIASHASGWIAAARAASLPVVTMHDLGLGCTDGDLVIDGSVTSPAPAARRHGAAGPSFSVLDPAVATTRARLRRGVLVSLGGGPRIELAGSIAREIVRLAPWVKVRVAGGFVSATSSALQERQKNVTWVGPSANLLSELSRAKVAVVGGGVSLYEAAALGTASVGVPVVHAQRPTVAGFVSRGMALGSANGRPNTRQIADDVLKLLRDDLLRHRLGRNGRRLVDGRGSERAARAIGRLLDRHASLAARRATGKGLRFAS